MEKKKPLSITELDVEPISDAELQAINAGASEWGSYVECCSGSDDVTIWICDAT